MEKTKTNDDLTYRNSIGIEFILIPQGDFYMGSREYERNWYRNDHPLHKVRMGRSFYIGKYPVTQKEWIKVMDFNPSRAIGDNNPVDKVTWHDAQEFISRLNSMEGIERYRLASEAEGEYACRANTETRYSFGDDPLDLSEHGWYVEDNSTGTYPVGLKKANPWGLFDMHGNIWEWVQDSYHDSYTGAPDDGSAWVDSDAKKDIRVLRGGSWLASAAGCRSVSRYFYPAGGRKSRRIGFRLVMDV